MLPVLYSFRRCPYAMRARMSLLYSSIDVELREVLLREKPPAMLAISAKGTVPVLLLPNAIVLDQSRDIMLWALNIHDPEHWLNEELVAPINGLIEQNDNQFKAHLDCYKYWERYPAESQLFYRTHAEKFLLLLENLLLSHRYLLAGRITMADIALFPFVRQFAFVDKAWFDQAPYPRLQFWLQTFIDSALFERAMKKSPFWKEGDSTVRLHE